MMTKPEDFSLGKWLKVTSRSAGSREVLDFGSFTMHRPKEIRQLAEHLKKWADWQEMESVKNVG